MNTTTFDQAQHDAWAQDTETPSEAEERAVIEAGRVLDIMTDAALVEQADEHAEDLAAFHAEQDTLRTEATTFWWY